MKSIAIGVHLRREDVEPLAVPVPVREVVLSAIDVPDDQPLTDRDLLVRTTALRSALLDRATFIAVRYGFTFRDAAEAEEKVIARAGRWRSLLEEHRGRVEFTLKIAAPGSPRPDRRSFRSGAEYLRALHDARDAATVPETFRRAVERIVIPLAVQHRWMKRDATSVELAGLIEREALPRLGQAGEELKRAAADVPFLLSGPWPLEVFAE